MEPGERANTKFHEMANKFHDFWRQTRNTHSSTSSNRPMLLHIGILTCQLLCALAAHGLVDHPIASEFNPTYLDSQWRLTGPGVDVDATVPGDLITDLQRGNVIGDPLFGLNFANTLWDSGDFIYTRRFDANEILNSNVAQVMLVFDSIKMASIIELNGQSVGITTNQFRRYTFDVLPLLRSFNNTLTVRFVPSNHSLNANARFMSCSGAWDWAPYSNTFTVNGTHTFTKGIVRSVYLLPIANVAITYIVPQVFYLGARPTSPLSSSDAATFRLQVRVHLHVSGVMKNPVQVSITGEWPGGNIPVTGSVFAPRGNTFIDLTVDPISAVDLWWPRGLGSQNMYNISVSAQSSPTMAAVAKRRIGFRAVDLVTTDDATSTSGSGDFTMRFRINGASPVLRGANMIPMEELEGRQTAEAYRRILTSAAEGNVNALRVWGGGIYLPDVFYDTCDELGILIALHDVMYGFPWFGGNESIPVPSVDQSEELKHSIRRLSSHPAILAWNGGNEWFRLSSPKPYEQFVLPTIASEDQSRPIWPCSPSAGLETGVDAQTGMPNGEPFKIINQTSLIERHGPYLHGGGFRTHNSISNFTPFDPNIPAELNSPWTPLGTAYSGVFASEFGVSVFSSYESMSPTLSVDQRYAHSAEMFERNYCQDTITYNYFGIAPYNDTSSTDRSFQELTYLSMLGSALYLMADIAVRRSANQFGLFIWQLGEIWPTGGWGSLEYGPAAGFTAGQVLGGRWKPAHHLLSQHSFRDTILLCGASGACMFRHDNPMSALTNVKVVLQIVHLQSGLVSPLASWLVSTGPGPAAVQWFCAQGQRMTQSTICPMWYSVLESVKCLGNGTDCVVQSFLYSSHGDVLDSDVILMNTPSVLQLQPATVQATFGQTREDGTTPITVNSYGGVALYVTLTSLAQGRFSQNALLIRPGVPIELLFLPFVDGDVPSASDTRIDHVGMYL